MAMKKFIIGILIAICTLCLGFAVACVDGSEPKYYLITFTKVEGITYNCDIKSGYEVREGATVSFSITCADNVVGEPTVTVNDSKINKDGNGNYSFKMTSDSVVNVLDIFVRHKYEVTFDKGDPDGDDYLYIKYSSEDGDTEKGIIAEGGTQISFTVDMSVYYDTSKMKVLANTVVINPDDKGVYTFTVTNDTNITVRDITLGQWFGEKSAEEGGEGTRDNPFIVTSPIDLYEISAMVNTNAPGTSIFKSAYYKLANDIDMKGEQLFIIGNSQELPFLGHFDGNGKTISNFYITDTLISSETYQPYHTPFVGLFGSTSSTMLENGNAEIYNLRLDNFKISVNAAEEGSSFFVGGIVGHGYGVSITGCETTNGLIEVVGDDEYFGYVGGIIGYQLSVYRNSSSAYTSVVNACSSSVTIEGLAGCINAAGGIAGIVEAQSPEVASAVINCYSTGNVSGAMYSGGIVGVLRPFCSVQGCYSTGSVEARNTNGLRPGIEQYAYAYAGGIAGYVEYDAIVADSFSVSKTYAYSSADVTGGKYAYTGSITGGLSQGGVVDATIPVEANPAIQLNCYADNINKDLILNKLGWHSEDWIFEGDNQFPVINKSADGRKQFTLKLNFGNETYNSKNELNIAVDSVYIPMSYWFIRTPDLDSNGFINADSGKRSYGYYFDAELKNRVPNGYIPINGITLYLGFADYSEVAGEYSFKDAAKSYVKLDKDGTLNYFDGALNHTSYYSYDGNEIVLYNTFIAIAFDGADTYQTFKAVIDGETMLIYDNGNHPVPDALILYKKHDNFKYGNYYDANGTVYIFEVNGKGSIVYSSGTQAFTYTEKEGGLIIDIDGLRVDCAVNAEGYVTSFDYVELKPFDKYYGVWEKSASSKKQYIFDGKGGYTFVTFGYDKDGNRVNESKTSGTYTINTDGELVFGGLRVGFNQDGFIEIGGEMYYRENSFVGVWNFFNKTDPVEITFNGIGVNGVGSAFVDYGEIGSYDAVYVSTTDADGKPVISLYYNDLPLGLLTYNAGDNTLTGQIYVIRNSSIIQNAIFFLYDDFRGSWISETGNLELIEFNGLGNYDVNGNSNHLAVVGNIKINGVEAGKYTLVNSTLTGSFEFEGVTYNIAYDEENDIISVTYGSGGSFDFIKHDKMYGLDLKDGSGNVYSFDGRGNLASGGKLTVKNGSTETNYTYKFASANNITISGAATGSLTMGEDFTLNLDGATSTLYVVNGFTGEWLVPDDDNKLVIGDINAAMKAHGKMFGQNTEFVYHNEDGGYLTFIVKDTETHEDVMFYVSQLVSDDGVTELMVYLQNGDIALSIVCISPSRIDGYKGEYTSSITGNYIEMNGFGASNHVKGVARQYENGMLIATYSYTATAKFGVEFMDDVTGARYLFVECSSDVEGAYTKDGKSYKLVKCDFLYGYSAYLATLGENGKLEVSDTVSFEFNGIGTLKGNNGNVYSYTIDLRDRANSQCALTLTDSSGAKLRALVDYSGLKVTIEFGKCDSTPTDKFIDGENKIYSFNGLSNLSVGGVFYVTEGSKTTLLDYKISASGEISILNPNGTDYGKFVKDGDDYKIILANKKEVALTIYKETL